MVASESGARRLEVEQESLRHEPAGKAGQRAGRSNDTMAGRHDRNRIAAIGGADRAHCRREMAKMTPMSDVKTAIMDAAAAALA
jgi:hypothetical protein